jgi:hypothetical protein
MDDYHVTGSRRALNQTATAGGLSLRDWATDGSILWHAARRTKLALPELPEKTMDLILP